MTDFDMVRSYYKRFDEKNRLAATNSGKLEYTMTKRILDKYLPESAAVLDLGGGTGAYAFSLADERLSGSSCRSVGRSYQTGETRKRRKR